MVPVPDLTFTLPHCVNEESLKNIKGDNSKVIIVGLIGKSPRVGSRWKPVCLDEFLGKSVFHNMMQNSNNICIQGYYHPNMGCILLHLQNSNVRKSDAGTKADSPSENEDFLTFWAKETEPEHRLVLLFFLVCHIIVIQSPSIPDTSVVHNLRLVDNARSRLQGSLSKALESYNISSEWSSQGRLCIPRLVFYVASSPVVEDTEKLSQAIQDQLFRLLRKAKLIANNPSQALCSVPSNSTYVFVNKPNGDFHEFLNNHIEAVRQGKLIDQVGRHSSNLHTEIPTASAWFQVINPLYDHFVNIQVGSTFEKTFAGLHSALDIASQFSEIRCKKVFPLALAHYQENLPSHYSSHVHQNKLTAACAMFASQARGPATDRWLTRLQEECDEVWASGRQVCEAPSLTGKPCIQPQHRTHPDQSGSLQVLPHSSGYRMVSACSCGSKQGNRDDPFDVKSANFTFYYYMNEECCHRFQAVNFPVFQPGSTTARPAPVRKNVKDMDFVQCTQELSLEASEDLSLSQSDYSLNDEDDLSSSEMESPTEFLPDTTVQVDTAEYLVGMPHTLSSSALPLYPSWSLLCRGPSSLYSHSVGLAQMPGFGSGAVHLTVWEVTLQLSPAGATVAEEWRIKKGSGKPLRRNKDGSAEMTTKIFLGTEYECPRGHRFLLPLPAAPRTGKTHLYPHTDTPLYLPCPCRPNNQLCAQLMRVHVVTPRTPFSVYLHPKVRPAPLTCPVFTTGIKEPLELTPSSYWVLRLPWAYENGPDEIYTPPMKSPVASYGVLLTEWIGVRENATGELKK